MKLIFWNILTENRYKSKAGHVGLIIKLINYIVYVTYELGWANQKVTRYGKNYE